MFSYEQVTNVIEFLFLISDIYKIYKNFRRELVFNNKNKKNKNIYWDLKESVSVKWIDNNIVNINGQKLNVPNDKYDYRHK